MNIAELIGANLLVAKLQASPQSVVVPPRGQSKERHDEFWTSINVDPNSINANAWKSFHAYVQDLKNIPSEWTLSPKFPSINTANHKWTSGTDEHARPFIIGLRLGELISTHQSNTLVAVNVKNSGSFSETYTPDTTRPAIDTSVEDEIKSQDKEPDVFLLSLLAEFVPLSNFGWICKANDALEMATAETIYQIKRKVKRQRPYTSGTIISIPKHSSWPGGHGYRVGALARFLYIALVEKIGDQAKRELFRQRLSLGAWRIAMNREAAGLHWHYDTLVGLRLGESLVDLLVKSVASIPANTPGQEDLLDVGALIAEIRR